MTQLLQLQTSLNGPEGLSSSLAAAYVNALRRRTAVTVVTRDLSADPVPHLSATRFQAFVTAPGDRTAEQRDLVAVSDILIDELKVADTVVIALPMHNFGVPSTFKAWIDHVARAGITFRYTENGSEGLLKHKRAIVFATRGGRYVGTPMDTQTAYVRHILGFLGITEVEFVYAEGTAMGEEVREQAVKNAHTQIAGLLPEDTLKRGQVTFS